MSTIKKKGIDETLTVPINHKDSNVSNLRSFETNIRTINTGIMSISRHIGLLETKVQAADELSKCLPDLKVQLANIESTQNTHTQLLTDLFEIVKQMGKSLLQSVVTPSPIVASAELRVVEPQAAEFKNTKHIRTRSKSYRETTLSKGAVNVISKGPSPKETKLREQLNKRFSTIETIPEEIVEPSDEKEEQFQLEVIADSIEGLADSVDSVFEPAAEPIAEPVVEKTVESAITPVAESVVEPTAEPIAESVVEPVVEKAETVASIVESVAEPVATPPVEQTPPKSAKSKTKPKTKSKSKPKLKAKPIEEPPAPLPKKEETVVPAEPIVSVVSDAPTESEEVEEIVEVIEEEVYE